MTKGATVFVAAVLSLLVTGCASGPSTTDGTPVSAESGTPGLPSTSGPTATSTPPEGPSLVGVDPCDLLTTADRDQLGLVNSIGSSQEGEARVVCSFVDVDTPFGAGVFVNTAKPLDDYRAPAADKQIIDGSFVGLPAVTVRQRQLDACTIAIGVAQDQLLVVNSAMDSSASMDVICQRTEAIARAAEANLPD